MTTLLLAVLALSLSACKPEYTIPSSELPTLHEGEVLWLDLTKWNSASISDTTEVKKLWDAIHISSTLQGNVNREKPVLYLDYVNAEKTNTDEYWWDIFSKGGEWLSGKEKVVVYDPVKACEILRDRIKGLVVYDPKVPATSCVASMVAGVEDLVAVRYDATPGSFYTRLIAHGFEPKVWLVNQDGSSKFTSKTDTYRWAIDNYLKPGKCNTEYMGYYIDQCWMKNPGASTKNHHQLSNHDFFVSQRAFFFDLSPWDDEAATDDPDGEVGGDYRTLKEILLEAYHHNGDGDKFCHIGGFPAWAYKYSNHSKVGGCHTPVETEWKFAEIIGEYNAFKDADAIAYGAMANASFWQHFPLQEKYTQKWVTREALKEKGYLNQDGTVNMSKRFVLLYVGDYDAASWIYQTTTSIFDDPMRGTVPMMWSVSPILCRRAPMAMHYMWTHATENDYFAAADNGAGYLNPGSLEEPRRISNLPSGVAQWAAHCKPWYEKWGITVTGFIIDGNARKMSDEGLKAYATFSPNGIVPQLVDGQARLVDGMPVLKSGGSSGEDRTEDAVRNIQSATKAHTDFPFYWFRAVLKTPTWYAGVKEGLDKQSPEIVWTTGPEFFELLKCYLETSK
ncbi:MAG: hypothetical protein MJY56_05050 [Bacteroidales bacterium]|nr:hypothetical protein [Bacteroidales bacterium]